MALPRVGDDHLVAVAGVLEEVEDAFFFHEPADEGEVRLAILNAVIARLELPLDLVGDVEPLQHLLKDVGHRYVLEDPALYAARQEPELRRDFHAIGGERAVGGPFADAATDA